MGLFWTLSTIQVPRANFIPHLRLSDVPPVSLKSRPTNEQIPLPRCRQHLYNSVTRVIREAVILVDPRTAAPTAGSSDGCLHCAALAIPPAHCAVQRYARVPARGRRNSIGTELHRDGQEACTFTRMSGREDGGMTGYSYAVQ